jgi:hypothetical protein
VFWRNIGKCTQRVSKIIWTVPGVSPLTFNNPHKLSNALEVFQKGLRYPLIAAQKFFQEPIGAWGIFCPFPGYVVVTYKVIFQKVATENVKKYPVSAIDSRRPI